MKKIIGLLVLLSLLVSFQGISSAQVYRCSSCNTRRQFRYPVNGYPPFPVMRVHTVVVVREYTIIRERVPASRIAYRTVNNQVRRSDPGNFKPPYRENNGYRTRRDYTNDNAYRIDRIEQEVRQLKKTLEAMEQRLEQKTEMFESLNRELKELRELLIEFRNRQLRR